MIKPFRSHDLDDDSLLWLMSIFLYVSEENSVFNHNNTHLLISAFIFALVLPEDVVNL